MGCSVNIPIDKEIAVALIFSLSGFAIRSNQLCFRSIEMCLYSIVFFIKLSRDPRSQDRGADLSRQGIDNNLTVYEKNLRSTIF